jgi:hypothetical protein
MSVSTPSFTTSLENWAFALPAQRVEANATSAMAANLIGVLPIDVVFAGEPLFSIMRWKAAGPQ